jgi:hypothetical protein
MSPRLPLVLSPIDLPIVELQAARLDGELFRIDDAYACIDEIEQPTHRASSLKAGLPERLIAEQHTAAWVWGVLARPPLHHEFCVPHAARVRGPGGGWLRVREVVIPQSDIMVLDGMPVTSPLRTAVDLARFSAHFGKVEETIVTGLMQRFGFTLADCQRHMNSRRNLPGKLQACVRLQIDSDGETVSRS